MLVVDLPTARPLPAERCPPTRRRRSSKTRHIYGYPLVTMDMTRKVMTNVAQPEGTPRTDRPVRADAAVPTAAFRDVTAPNADTLYTSGWVDVGNEPWCCRCPMPTTGTYLFPMLDGYTNVFESPGKRTTGTGPQTYAITGPGWKGTLARRGEGSTSRPPRWSGCWVASTAPAPRRTTRRSTRCRTRSN